MTTALAAPILADAARHYAEVGWYVHPLRPQAKLPATRHGVLDATNDVARVEAWWRLLPRANIGIATGPVRAARCRPRWRDGPSVVDTACRTQRRS